MDLSGTQLKVWVKNISKYALKKEEESVLAKGLNFAITPEKSPIEDFIVATELACTNLPTSDANSLRGEAAKILGSNNKPKHNITKSEREAIKSLQKQDSIIVLPADKGKCVVVMDKTEYLEKANTMLSDTRTYTKLKSDPTNKIRDKLIKKLNKLKDQGKITEKQLHYLKPSTNPTTPRFYGTPKVHKNGNPLRPIVDYTGSVTYKVARELADLLKPLMGTTEHHLENSKDLKKKLEGVKLSEDECMISHDVVSLFTNVPIPEAIKVIENRLKQDKALKTRTNLHVEDIVDLLTFVCSTTYFSFQGELYEQKFGTAMGSPVSPIIANLYMEHIEQTALATCPEYCKPRLWLRYVDDIFEIAPKQHLDDLTNHINQTDPTGNIKFTMEKETNNQQAMLDVLVKRNQNGTVTTTIFRKATHTDQYLNFTSHHPLHQKLGVVRSLIDRKDTIVTDPEEKNKEETHIEAALKKNGYPKWAIKKAKSDKENKNKGKQKKKQNETTCKNMVVIPYVNKTSEQLAACFKKYGVTSAMRPACTLRSLLVHPKDKIKDEKKAGVVYRIPCQNCPRVYIGQTGRHLGTRVNEHKVDVENHEKRNYTQSARKTSTTEMNKSAITDHVNTCNHVINWDKVKIVAREDQEKSRLIRESIEIQKHPTNMNRDQGNYPLSVIYQSLLSTDGAVGNMYQLS